MKVVTSRNTIGWGAARGRSHLLSKSALALALALSLGTATPSDAAQVEVLDPIALPSGFLYPNGITQAPDGTLFVGSVISGEIVTVGNEGVARFDAEDPSVFAGTSLRMDANAGRLWGSSPDFLGVEQPDGSVHRRAHRIFARDVDTGAVDLVMLVPDAGFANDIVIGADGTLFITDTSIPRILTLAPGANRLSVLVWDGRLASDGEGVDGIGAAGIAIAADGQSLLVGLYGAGTVFAIEDSGSGNMEARPLKLQRPLENPDGFTVDRNGDLLLVEGSVASGNGRLTRIVDPLSAGPRPIETLVEDLDIPVNLLIDAADPSLVYVTESGLGHRFTDSRRADNPPEVFYVRRYRLN